MAMSLSISCGITFSWVQQDFIDDKSILLCVFIWSNVDQQQISNCLPNKLQDPPDWTEILQNFRGSELQNYFTKILEDDLKAIFKPQYVDQIPKAVKVSCRSLTQSKTLIGCLG